MFPPGQWPVTIGWGALALRPIRYRDRAEWDAVRARNAEWLGPWEASSPAPNGTLPTFRHMVAALKAQARAGGGLPFVITEVRDDVPRLVGQLTVSSITYGSLMGATLGYWVDRASAGRGIAPTAVALATDHCFTGLGLHRMEINIRPENARSLRVVQKLGFRDEGIRRAYLHIDGRWADHRSFALTADEVPGGLLHRWLTEGAVG
ncbi:GNAT family N-acetyltransferase [Tersicoccus phoenicis]|uniref:GNAT family N-acetyltransferase n=1 Tax=Tersicoccus phoenicis TaxID=554083 RepID=A0A1R1L6D6_9MICC|nr:GNAT family protein [Tersicoccus phoenicis]OMH23083.1 GNAT family N-acetyltransferase [Tersicoccus phoenicis]